MNAHDTLNAWKDFSRSHSKGGADNLFRHNGSLYGFDAHPRPLQNGALQGRVYRQDPGQLMQDIGGFKINADGSIAALPQELHGVLPDGTPTIAALARAERSKNAFIWEDVQ